MSPDELITIEPTSLEEARELLDRFVVLVGAQQQRIEELEAKLEEVLERATRSSRNSHNPPSSDSTAQRGKRKKKSSSGRSRGAQPGHPKHERRLVDESELDAVHDHFPDGICGCGAAVELCGAPVRHQMFDLPPIRPIITEHRLHGGVCRGCGRRHVGSVPPGVAAGQMGPSLIALIATLSGQYHLSTRKIRRLLDEVLGVRFSLGAVSEAQGKAIAAMAGPYLEIGQHVRAQPVVHADETRHFQGTWMNWMWVLACPEAAWFVSHYSRGKSAADQLLGESRAVVVSDDYVGYDRVPEERRQLCWSHLLRNFTAVAERAGSAGAVGAELVEVAEALFGLHRELAAGRLGEDDRRAECQRLRARCRAALERGARLRLEGRTRAQCRRWLKREAMFWTHLDNAAVPIDNNAAERALRGYVKWRSLCTISSSV